MSISTASYSDMHEKYSKAIEWMADIGVKLGPNRLVHYDKIVGAWKDAYKTASEEQGNEVFPDFVNSVFEIHDFVDVYSAFKNTPKERLHKIISKLDKGVNGPEHAANETPKNSQARNHLFEAATAARSHRPESGIEAILDAESDTGVRVDNSKVWIECKRVTTPEKIYDNVRRATRQLEAILEKEIGSGHRAIVALDISKILNEGDKILVKDTEAELLSSLDHFMDLFVRQYYREWEKVYERRDRKIIGTLIRFSFMSIVEDRNLLVHTSEWGVNPRITASLADAHLQRTLAEKLKRTP